MWDVGVDPVMAALEVPCATQELFVIYMWAVGMRAVSVGAVGVGAVPVRGMSVALSATIECEVKRWAALI